MRLQLYIPDTEYQRLCEIAHEERRFPKQQAEYILIRSIREALTAERHAALAGR